MPSSNRSVQNAIAPIQDYIRLRAAAAKDAQGCRVDKSEFERQATDRSLGASKKNGYGLSYEDEIDVKFRGMGKHKEGKTEVIPAVKARGASLYFNSKLEFAIPCNICAFLRINSDEKIHVL